MNPATKEMYRVAGVKPPAQKRIKKPLTPLPPIKWFTEATRRLRDADDGWTRVVLPYPLSVNASYSIGVIGGKNVKARAMMRPSEAAEQYKEFMDAFFALERFTPLIGDVQVIVDLYRARKAGDSDVTKLLFDCLETRLYVNDSQIADHLVHRHDDPNFPRCVVAVRLKAGQTLNLEFPK